MTQDCLNSPSAANECKVIPKGINIIGADHFGASTTETVPSSQQPWGYLMLQHMMAKKLEEQLKAYNSNPANTPQPFFIHKSYRYQYKNADGTGGVKKTYAVSVSGLVFLQGTTSQLQTFLSANYPTFHLVNNCATGRPASIPDTIMQPFMNTVKERPENITFLHDKFAQFAKNHVKLRVLTGLFKGCEGYIVRIDRDRQLVFDFAGRAVAVRGVHKEQFMVVE